MIKQTIAFLSHHNNWRLGIAAYFVFSFNGIGHRVKCYEREILDSTTFVNKFKR